MTSMLSAASCVVIAHVAVGTKQIRVVAGVILLPNVARYVIAEQFGTLVGLFPGLLVLGLGRAPFNYQITLRALRTL
jgi:alkanesulfonate monooxygenase SsuD/methylene tetrahydromethanopterin reductase-like flavin-dependent oxidoreductase (luciferase family)